MIRPDTNLSKRITKSDLLMAGWHNIWHWSTGSRWAHPRISDNLKFDDTAGVLKKRGIDEMGEMK